MERVLTQDERIRRAEEIYLRRRNLQQPQYKVQNTIDRSAVKSNSIKSIKLFKRIALQIVICLLLYCIFYLIYDTNFSFSTVTINKTEEILNYDINIEELYKNASTYINELIHKEENVQENTEEENQEKEELEDTTNQESQEQLQDNQSAEIIQEEQTEKEEVTEQTVQEETTEQTEQVSTEEVDLKQVYSLIRPVQRRIYFF